MSEVEPIRPVFEREEDSTFDLVVKTDAPDESQPGRTMSSILECLHCGEEMNVKGPVGEIKCIGQVKFKIEDKGNSSERDVLLALQGMRTLSRCISSANEGSNRYIHGITTVAELLLVAQPVDAVVFQKLPIEVVHRVRQ
ncbi:uncharacterized protein N7500_004637 [Penicillium coprophilum]|uniref:uncharacterized protein n=1 Tax=Penicillium coprophilum TaxID=36646 RepID=UPI00238BA858|nr:uncharacterized protein N7500_004637 [Penicillium coprophilum]KAJ5162807.1 hypothetical protein N7500_004637 [Penicillium coprophilum]